MLSEGVRPFRTASSAAFTPYSGRVILSEEMELLAVLQHDIAVRLRPVCGNMPEPEFEQLVRDIAAVKLKYGVESQLSAAFRERLTAALDERPPGGSKPSS